MTTTAERIIDNVAAGEKAPEKTIDKRRALGRGLESLLPSGPRVVAEAPAAGGEQPGILAELQGQAAPRGVTVSQIELDQIDENPYQTRYFSKSEQESDNPARTLKELAESIKANGVIQPIMVRPGNDGRYILILGERRCRASKIAGKTTIPAMVRKVSEQQAAEMTVVENLQRKDLNCLEQAQAFAKLSQDFKLTQEEIGKQVGISRESVANYMRLLKLPDSVRSYLHKGTLGFSEARLLLRLDDGATAERIANDAVNKKWSWYQLDDAIDEINMAIHRYPQQKTARGARWVDPNVKQVQGELQSLLGVKVKISDRRGKGKIVIEYADIDDFERVVEMLKGKS